MQGPFQHNNSNVFFAKPKPNPGTLCIFLVYFKFPYLRLLSINIIIIWFVYFPESWYFECFANQENHMFQ